MNYIIDPMWFYWMSVADNLLVTCAVIGGLFGILSMVFGAILITNMEYGPNYDDYKKAKKALKVFMPLSILFILLSVFIPSKEILIEMQIAKFATYENAEWTIDAIKGLVDYIVEAMKSV